MHPCHPGTPPLIQHGTQLLIGIIFLNNLPNLSINHFIHMLLNLLNGITLAQLNQPPTLLPPPPPQPQLTRPTPHKKSQMCDQPNLNPNNKQEKQVYSGVTSYPTYVVDIQEIKLRSG